MFVNIVNFDDNDSTEMPLFMIIRLLNFDAVNFGCVPFRCPSINCEVCMERKHEKLLEIVHQFRLIPHPAKYFYWPLFPFTTFIACQLLFSQGNNLSDDSFLLSFKQYQIERQIKEWSQKIRRSQVIQMLLNSSKSNPRRCDLFFFFLMWSKWKIYEIYRKIKRSIQQLTKRCQVAVNGT